MTWILLVIFSTGTWNYYATESGQDCRAAAAQFTRAGTIKESSCFQTDEKGQAALHRAYQAQEKRRAEK
jgi:hypothetical protein